MDNQDLQVENGNFTRIVNPLIEELVKIPFKGCELAVALFIIRKTYGYQKKQDEISLTQFEIGVNRSRQTIVTALKNLQLVNVARLVKQGTSQKHSNLWEINKYSDTWKLVKTARLVKRKRGTSLTEGLQLVKTARHTKEIQKKYTKESDTLRPAVAEGEFSFKSQLTKMFADNDRRMAIIGYYWVVKGFSFDNRDKYSSALKRELKASGDLKGYSNEEIKRTCEWLKQNSDFKWTLETVLKYIDEPLENLKTGGKPLTEEEKIKKILNS